MFSSTFQGKFNFQGLLKTVLYIQVLFKPVRTMQLNLIKWKSKGLEVLFQIINSLNYREVDIKI